MLQNCRSGAFCDPPLESRCSQTAVVVRACGAVVAATDRVRATFGYLERAFREDVIQSHGNHIPIAVRDGAVVMFWVPLLIKRIMRHDSAALRGTSQNQDDAAVRRRKYATSMQLNISLL